MPVARYKKESRIAYANSKIHSEMSTQDLAFVTAPNQPRTRRASDCFRQRRCSVFGQRTVYQKLVLPTLLNIATCLASTAPLLESGNKYLGRLESRFSRTPSTLKVAENVDPRMELSSMRSMLLRSNVAEPPKPRRTLSFVSCAMPSCISSSSSMISNQPGSSAQDSRREVARSCEAPVRRAPKLSRTKEVN